MIYSARTDFALLTQLPEELISVEQLASEIGRIIAPNVSAADNARQLDALAAQVQDQVDPNLPPDRLAAALRRAIVEELGFEGDEDDYDHPDNSCLARVLARRRGMPILLSAVWVALGARLGAPVRGVGYPGHFLVCLDAPGARFYLDPFHHGRPLHVQDLIAGLQGLPRSLLEPIPPKAWGERILTNLKNAYLRREQPALALEAVDRLLLLSPKNLPALRERALIALRAGQRQEAITDLRRYLPLAPPSEDRDALARLLSSLTTAHATPTSN